MLLRHRAERAGKLITFLRTELNLSANLTQKLSKQGALAVNGKPARPYQKVAVGDEIAVTITEALPGYAPEEGQLDILYEDDAVIVLDKPVGITMHPTSARQDNTLAGRLVRYYRETGQECGIHFVSRLDRDTFGVVLAAKNGYIHGILQAAPLNKTYHGAVFGHPAQSEGEIVRPIGRVEGDALLRCASEDGQYAKSTYQVLKTTENCALLQLHPVTGRTNQLRVHCAYEGFPMLGDGQYGTAASMAFSARYGCETQQLCAAELTFPHPLTGETITICSRQTIKLPEGDPK